MRTGSMTRLSGPSIMSAPGNIKSRNCLSLAAHGMSRYPVRRKKPLQQLLKVLDGAGARS